MLRTTIVFSVALPLGCVACGNPSPDATPVLPIESLMEIQARRSPLNKAVMSGQADVVRELLDNGADPNACQKEAPLDYETLALGNEELLCPLLTAAASGHGEIVTMLLAHGADVDIVSGADSAIRQAITHGNPSIARQLHEKGAAFELTDALVSAVANLDMTEWLLGLGAHVNEHDSNGHLPLEVAAQKGNTRVVGLLLSRGADVNPRRAEGGLSPLGRAANRGHQEIVELLVASGADVNAREDDGGTPLHRAAHKGHRKAARLLLEHGADAKAATSNGITVLHAAVFAGAQNNELIGLLIEHGADIDVRTDDGVTPLHGAIHLGHTEVVLFLVAQGADVDAKTGGGLTASELAHRKGHQDIVEILEKATANP